MQTLNTYFPYDIFFVSPHLLITSIERNSMKKLNLIPLLLLTLFSLPFSQVDSDIIPNTAVDFTAIDTDGKEHHLFSYLEDDYHVLIMFALGG